MKIIKNIATKVIGFPVDETGALPFTLLTITIVIMSLIMRFCYC